MADLLDVNAWVALTTPEHVHHERATAYWSIEAQPPLLFNRTTALGLVRVTSKRNSLAGQPLSLSDAWAGFQILVESPHVQVAEDPSHCDEALGKLIATGSLTSNSLTDAYLAAFAMAGHHRLVTFDKDFLRFPDLNLLLLGIEKE